MLSINKATKKFGDFTALSEISCDIQDAGVFGLVGSNGAGKSTLVRLIAGVYKPDGGSVSLDGEEIYENSKAKSRIAYVSDELYFLPGASMDRMATMYESIYPGFDRARFAQLAEILHLNRKKNIAAFSKGMKRQAATILAIATRPDYIFFDETFDGLDPVMRNFVKNLICEDVMSRNATAIITSHSLRELEDTCDQLALLHKGGLVLESDVQNLKTSQFKIQIAFSEEYDESRFAGIDMRHFQKRGSVSNMIVRGEREETVQKLQAMCPILLDVLPLSLEEVFTYEMETMGYTFNLE